MNVVLQDPYGSSDPYGSLTLLVPLPVLKKNGLGRISRLPVCIRIILESVLRKSLYCTIAMAKKLLKRMSGNWLTGS
ncbi:MAG: hypothetical protein H6936_15505 [Burkholderiales bacterium]|nr:hypothetical protein [Burkholderiales bacterium]